jgi:phenylalanyl-tRNA synthetase beta chain
VALGYREIITSSMVDPAENARFTERPPVVLANPLSQESSALRSTPIPSMLAALRWNLDRDQADLHLFEVGKTYTARPGSSPEERRVLTLGVSGHRHPASVHESATQLDFFDLKGGLETLLAAFEAPELRFEPVGCPYHEAGFAGRFTAGGETLAVFGLLERALGRDYKLRQAVGLAEVDLGRLLDFTLRRLTFRPFSKFPAVERDFSLLVPAGTPYRALAAAIAGLGLEEILSFRPVERLPEGQIAAGHYSLLVRVTFQSERRTLTSDEVAAASRRLVAALEPLGARLRT